MNKRITVETVTERSLTGNDGRQFSFNVITDSEGNQYTASKKVEVTSGQAYDVTLGQTKKGDWTKLTNASIAGSEAPQEQKRYSDRDGSIETQVAAKAVVELVVAGTIKTSDPLWLQARKWLQSKLPKVELKEYAEDQYGAQEEGTK